MLQWKMKSTREKWRGRNYVFRKPEKDERLTKSKESVWW